MIISANGGLAVLLTRRIDALSTPLANLRCPASVRGRFDMPRPPHMDDLLDTHRSKRGRR